MKKRYLLMAIAAALVLTVVAGGSLAATQIGGTEKENVTASLDTKTLSIDLNSELAEKIAVELPNEIQMMPGDSVDLGGLYRVKNDGDKGDVAAYVRVTVHKTWLDSANKDENVALSGQMLDLTAMDGWLKAEDLFGRENTDTQVFYYATPLQPGQETSALLASLGLSEGAGNVYADKGIQLEAYAEGVQFAPGHNDVNAAGILASWGVHATLDDSGKIVSIAQ